MGVEANVGADLIPSLVQIILAQMLGSTAVPSELIANTYHLRKCGTNVGINLGTNVGVEKPVPPRQR